MNYMSTWNKYIETKQRRYVPIKWMYEYFRYLLDLAECKKTDSAVLFRDA